MKQELWIIIGLVAALFIGGVLGWSVKPGCDQTETVVVRDTVTVVDTVVKEKPVTVYKEKVRTEYVAVTDTVIRDSIAYVPVEIERKVYADEDYRAVVSGWHPSLDSIYVYPKTQIVTVNTTETIVEKKRVAFGATIGPTIVYNLKDSWYAGLGITAGLTITF